MVDDQAGLLDAISVRIGLSCPQTASAVEIMVALLKATLQRGESGQVVSFSHFTIQQKDPRTGWVSTPAKPFLSHLGKSSGP
jgi:nucleoid DNA-binding protein